MKNDLKRVIKDNQFETFVMTSISGGKAFGQARSHSSTLSNILSLPSQPKQEV
jgi:hypothetical protein